MSGCCPCFSGRFAWSLWNGYSGEELVMAGVWSVGVGLSVAVLQVPKIRVSQVQKLIDESVNYRDNIRKIIRGWPKMNEWSYAKFVRQPIEKFTPNMTNNAKFI